MTGWEDKDIILHNPWREYTADTFIFMPEMSKGLYLSSFARSVLRWMSKRGCGGDKIFVSRSGGLAARSKRQCLNGDRVESAMRKLGYSIFVPDRCSVVEQILTFSSARSIVGPSGAGMFNSVFCGADTCIVDIESQTNWLNAHVNLFSSLDVEFGVHWAKADLGVNSVQKPYLIDVDALCSLIESRQVPS
jgi:capsular polysaccharide biosynthesis protein